MRKTMFLPCLTTWQAAVLWLQQRELPRITKRILISLLICFCPFITLLAADPVRYVKAGGAGSETGVDWDNASGSIQAMIDELEGESGGGEVWVAGGTYVPEKQLKDYYSLISSEGDIYKSFFLKKDVRVFGGFKGDETQREDRNWKDNPTVLSGDLGGGINTFHVVVCTGDVGSARLDGFTITGGKAIDKYNTQIDGGNIFYGGHGGGLYVYQTPRLVLSHLILSANETVQGGGGIYVYRSDEVLMVNSLLYKNNASYYDGSKGGTGAGIYCSGSTATLLNVTISGNTAAHYGAGLDLVKAEPSTGADVKLINTIIWNNTSTAYTTPVVDEDANLFINKSCQLSATHSVYSYTPISGGVDIDIDSPDTNLSIDPQFSDPDNEDYRLKDSSPAIDTGEDAAALAEYTFDLDRQARKQGNHVDIGAFEYTTASPVLPTADFTAGSVSACKDLTGDLTITLTGTAPWTFLYRTSDMQDTDLDLKIENIQTSPYSLSVLAGITVTLTNVTDANATASITGVSKTVSAIPSADAGTITGQNSIQTGSTAQLATDGDTGGTWNSDNPAIVSVDANGLVTGNAAGSAVISYRVDNTCNVSEESFTMNVTAPWIPPVPPVPPVPDPNPDPNVDPWISVGRIADVCPLESEFRIPFTSGYNKEVLEYTITFSEEAKAAGLEDRNTPEILPVQLYYISVPIGTNVSGGTYKGTIQVCPRGDVSSTESFPFEVKIFDRVEIVRQPQGVKDTCEGDGLLLSVVATGKNLSYQWFHDAEKIEGAIQDTYETVMNAEAPGLYYVEVYSDCGVVNSDTVAVTRNILVVSVKWNDVLYMPDVQKSYIRFQWYKNGQPIQTHGTSIYYSNPEGLNGAYHVRAYYSEEAYDESCQLWFGEEMRSSNILVYPTILSQGHRLTVEDNKIDLTYQGALVELFTISGQKVYSGRMNDQKMEIPVVGRGSYVLQVTATNGKRTVEKIFCK